MKAAQVKLYESSCGVQHLHLLIIGDLMLQYSYTYYSHFMLVYFPNTPYLFRNNFGMLSYFKMPKIMVA